MRARSLSIRLVSRLAGCFLMYPNRMRSQPACTLLRGAGTCNCSQTDCRSLAKSRFCNSVFCVFITELQYTCTQREAIRKSHQHLGGFELMETLLSVEEAARKLGGISKWTVHAWLAKGKLRRTKVGGRTMIRESELQRVIHDESIETAGQ